MLVFCRAVLYTNYGKNTEKILKNCLGGREPSEDQILGLKEYFFKALDPLDNF